MNLVLSLLRISFLGKMSWFSLVWLGGVFFGMTRDSLNALPHNVGMIFNIHQEKMMIAVPLKTLNFPQQMKFTINLLRQQVYFALFPLALICRPLGCSFLRGSLWRCL